MSLPDLLFTLNVPTREGLVTIRAFDGGPCPYPDTHHHKIHVCVRFKGKTIFGLKDFWCGTPGGVTIDGDEAKELVCSLVAMRQGDTDEEYFASYTSDQLDFVGSFGEEISLYAERFKCRECGAVNGRSKFSHQGKTCKHHKRET